MHVMQVHLNALQSTTEETKEGELDLPTLKKFISFCRRQVEGGEIDILGYSLSHPTVSVVPDCQNKQQKSCVIAM